MGVEWGYNDGNVMQFFIMEMLCILTRRWTGVINLLIDLNTPNILWFKVCRLYVAVLAHHSHHADLVLVSWTIYGTDSVVSISCQHLRASRKDIPLQFKRRFLRVKQWECPKNCQLHAIFPWFWRWVGRSSSTVAPALELRAPSFFQHAIATILKNTY